MTRQHRRRDEPWSRSPSTSKAQITAANASGKTPVVFVHGLWLLPSSWDRWRTLFEEAGYSTLAPGWPDDPDTVAEANRNPKVFAGKSIKDVADHFDDVIRGLTTKPAIVGHSFGGLLTQILAGRGLSAASVAIDPAPFRGVLPLPISALRSSAPVLTNPLNRNRAVPLTYEQFRYAFANAVTADEAHELYDTFAVPAPGEPLFQAATANLNPWTEAKVDSKNPDRGPLLILDGELDHTVPGRSRMRPTTARSATPGSPRSPRSRGEAMPSPSTAAGATSPTCRSPSSGGSSSPDRDRVSGQAPSRVFPRAPPTGILRAFRGTSERWEACSGSTSVITRRRRRSWPVGPSSSCERPMVMLPMAASPSMPPRSGRRAASSALIASVATCGPSRPRSRRS